MSTPVEVMAEGIASEHQFRAEQRIEASPEDHAKAFAQAALDALEDAGYRVVPSHCAIPEMKLRLHFDKRDPLPNVRPNPFDPMS